MFENKDTLSSFKIDNEKYVSFFLKLSSLKNTQNKTQNILFIYTSRELHFVSLLIMIIGHLL